MIDHIELHDSRVAVERQDGTILFRLCPAYVHHWDRVDGCWVGEGRSQTAEIAVADGAVEPEIADTSDVADGWLEVGGRRYESMLPVPLSIVGDAQGGLELTDGSSIEFSGSAVSVRLLGKPELVESLPPDWAPHEAG
jgi:hypothetical protein